MKMYVDSLPLTCSRELSVGPEATVSLIVGSGLAHQKLPKDDPDSAAAAASLMAILVGLFTLGLGLLRLGFLDSLMSRALLRGFITAVAVVVLIQQTIFLLGLGSLAHAAGITPESTTVERILFLATHVHQIHPATTALSVAVLVLLISFSLLKKRCASLRRVPEVLLAVVLSTLVCRTWRLNEMGVEVLGRVGDESQFNAPLPWPSMPALPRGADIQGIFVNAAMISVIGFVESIAASKAFARKHNYFVSANRELVALGSANVLNGLFSGFPAFGSVSFVSSFSI